MKTTPSGHSSHKLWLALLAVGLFLGLIGWRLVLSGDRADSGFTPAADEPSPGRQTATAPGGGGPAGPVSKTPAPEEPSEPDPALLAEFRSFLALLRSSSPSRDLVLAELARLKQRVHDLPPDVAAATLVALLKGGEDAATGLVFHVGEEGVLDEPNTYRVALLDLLGQTEPYAALAYSREILGLKTTPDEYAMALRNVAWLNLGGNLNAEIQAHFAEMLATPEWLEAPTAGFLESFDVAVELGGVDSLYQLTGLIDPPAPTGILTTVNSVNHAGFVALDRIMLREPETVISALMTDPQFLSHNPNFRASLVSRLDPTSPEQHGALEHYLLNVSHAPGELRYFATIFPNGNFLEGNRLVTSWETTYQEEDIEERDRRILPRIEAMRADPTYTAVADTLDVIIQRLRNFADPAMP